MSSASKVAPPMEAALRHALGLLKSERGPTGELAAEMLKVGPGHPRATLPVLTDAWRTLTDHFRATGDSAAAAAACAHQIKAAADDPRLLRPAAALCDDRIPEAEALLREHLERFPTDVSAIRMLAEVAARLGRYRDAESLLARTLELAPDFDAARHNYALVLHRQARAAEALRQVGQLLARDPDNPSYRNLKAAVLGTLGEYEQAIEIYESLIGEYPRQPKLWLTYGHVLKIAGKQAQCVRAYRRTLDLAPSMGEGYWGLANLKTFGFLPADCAAMRGQLERPDLADEDRCYIEFALGKALEDAGDYAGSFQQYAAGNRRRRGRICYDADEMTGLVRRSQALLTRTFFDERASFGSRYGDPIFIVGLPRAGSTLIEQILASHSAVEGTMELPDLIAMVRGLIGRSASGARAPYPDLLEELDAEECRAFGDQYLARTRIQRKTDAPFFIDKMPNNFAHIGLIQLTLPRAKIIDARRHPLGCGLSCFKQHFARGQHFSYSLDDIGRYYHDYAVLMAHVDRVLPGRVHRVFYETLVTDTEAEVRRLLSYCGLPFEERCLSFFDNQRAVRTASSEQVRKPIYVEGAEHWRHFEEKLAPLKSALGSVLENYPAVPGSA